MGPGFDDVPHFDSDVAMNIGFIWSRHSNPVGLGWNGMVCDENKSAVLCDFAWACHSDPCNFAWNWEWIRVWKLQIDSFHYSNLISLDVAFPVLARNGFEASHVPKAVSIMLLYTCEDFFFSSGIPAMSPNLTQRNCNVHKRFLRHIFFLWCVVVVGRASIWIALPLEIKLFESRSHMRSEIEIASYYCCCCCYYYVLVLVRLLLQLNAVPLQLLYWLPPLVRLSLLRHRTSATTVTVLPRLPRSCFITYYYYHHYYYYYYYY